MIIKLLYKTLPVFFTRGSTHFGEPQKQTGYSVNIRRVNFYGNNILFPLFL